MYTDNETLRSFINRIDGLENRINTIEDQKRKEGRGVWAMIIGFGKFVGICGGFVALLMAAALDLPQKVRERIAMPSTVMQPGEQLDLSWNREGQLNFNWPIELYNQGEGLDTVAAWSASISIMPDALGSKESFNLENICALAPERDRCIRPPLEVEARKGKGNRIEISIGSKLRPEKQQAFLKPGLHKLTLNLDFEAPGSKIRRNRFINWLADILKLDSKEPQPKPPIIYCFWLGPESADELVKAGHRSETHPDPSCQSGGQ